MEQGEILFSRLSVMKGGHVYPTTLHNMISKLEEVRDIEPSLEVKKDFKTKREGGMVYDGNDTLVLDRAGEGDSLAETTPWTGGDAPPVHHTGSPSLRVRTLHLIEDVLGVVETSFPSSGSDVKYELLCTIASVLLLLCDDVHVRRLVVGRSDGGDVEPSPCVVQWLETLRVWAELRADEGDDMQVRREFRCLETNLFVQDPFHFPLSSWCNRFDSYIWFPSSLDQLHAASVLHLLGSLSKGNCREDLSVAPL
tara:strand:- start:1380 stop:2138 length:759 start_codon:yes stop_codon:yes gene_type:complete